MKKGIIFLAVIAILAMVLFPIQKENTETSAPSPDLQQSLNELKDSWNALKDGVQSVSNDVSTAIDDTKNSIEEVTGVGSVSKLLDGGNSFAYDCAIEWFQMYSAEIDAPIEISGSSLLSVERKREHAEDSMLGDCSKYAVTFLVSIDPDGEMPIDNSVTITIYTANDGSGYYVVTKVSDEWSIFAGTFASYGIYSAE